MNKIILMGRLTADPELKVTDNGIEHTSFIIAVDRPTAKDKEKVADFIPCMAWRQTAVFINKYFNKGDKILVDGTMQSRKWTDSEGKTRYGYDALISHAEFCNGKRDSDPWESNTAPSGGNQSYNPYSASGNAPQFEEVPGDDNLPF